MATVGPTKEFPAFFCPTSGHSSPHQVSDVSEAARLVKSHHDLGLRSGVLLAVPIPDSEAAAGEAIGRAIEEAVREAEEQGVAGREVTPFVLARVNQLTGGLR